VVVGASRDEERIETPRGCACEGVLLQNAATLGAVAGGGIVVQDLHFADAD
jgi:hypothetical protein